MKSIFFILFITIIVNTSCAKKDDLATTAGKEYCDCMKKHSFLKDDYYAHFICDAQLIQHYRLLRLDRIEMDYKHLREKIGYSTRDSINNFYHRYRNYLKNNCCKEAGLCIERKEKYILKETDYKPRQAAVDYCECMNANRFLIQREYAEKVCKAELVEKYKFFRILFVDLPTTGINDVPGDVEDTVKVFVNEFNIHLDDNCNLYAPSKK